MKIGINARFLSAPYVGIGQHTIRLLENIAKLDSKNEYYLFTHVAVKDFELPDNFTIVVVPERKKILGSGFAKIWWEQMIVPATCEKMGLDIYHTLYEAAPMLDQPFAVVSTVHDIIPWEVVDYKKKIGTKFRLWVNKRGLAKSDKIISVSINSKIRILGLIGLEKQKKIEVLPNGRSKFFKPTESIEKRDFVKNRYKLKNPFFLYVGSFETRKNLKRSLQAFKYLVKEKGYNDIDFVIVGSTPENSNPDLYFEIADLSLYAEDAGIKDKVKFVGSVSSEDLAALYTMSKALIYPSIYEGFGMQIVEALASMIPIVTSYAGVLMEVSRGHAVLVDPFNPKSIAEGMEEVLTNGQLVARNTMAGYKSSFFYDWEEIAKRTLSLYIKTLSEWKEEKEESKNTKNKSKKVKSAENKKAEEKKSELQNELNNE